jgi:Transketolase, N-terminal subunit
MTNNIKVKELEMQAAKIRKRLVEVVCSAKAGHIGGGLSATDVLTALYLEIMNVDPHQPKMEGRDRFIMSKGHSVEALYCVLEAAGFITPEILDTYGKCGSILAGHPTIKVPGVEVNSGALGHGLSIGVGMAIAAKMDKKNYRTFVLMGDGEQGEGSIYEAAMAGSHYQLDNLVAIIDRNRLQISGCTEDVMSLEPMRERWESFGWEVLEMDGNNMAEILNTINDIDYANERPHLIISHTIKGKGISYMENEAVWHHGVPKESQQEAAIQEINERMAAM